MPHLPRGIGLLGLFLAAALSSTWSLPAVALLITSEVAVSTAVELDTSNTVLRRADADTTSGAPANARVQLGDGVNAFAQPTFAQAFSTFHDDQATYWVNLNADNTRAPDNRGIGAAGVQLIYTAVKEAGDRSFTLHTTGGNLRIDDPDAGSIPLIARVEIDALVLHEQDVLARVSAHAELFGNGGATSDPVDHFQLFSDGFDIQFGDFIINLDSNLGSNEVGAALRLRPLNIPVDLSRIVDGTPITISVTLNGEVRAPGAETIASAFFRDPTRVDDPDPLAGASAITFETVPIGPPNSVPEPSNRVLLAPALLAAWRFGRRRTLANWVAS